MKKKNIKIGEWVFYKEESAIVKVKETHIEDGETIIHADSQCLTALDIPQSFSKPRISDLKAGDVFEVLIRNRLQKFTYKNRVNLSVYAEPCGHTFLIEFPLDTKIRVISLASEQTKGNDITFGAAGEESLTIKAEGSLTTPGKTAPSTKLDLTYVERDTDDEIVGNIKTSGASDKYHAEMAEVKAEIEKPEPKANRDVLGDLKDCERMFPIEPEPERKVLKRWVNVYPSGVRLVLHETREGADNLASRCTDRTACVEIEIPYYEGEGL